MNPLLKQLRNVSLFIMAWIALGLLAAAMKLDATRLHFYWYFGAFLFILMLARVIRLHISAKGRQP